MNSQGDKTAYRFLGLLSDPLEVIKLILQEYS